MTFIIALGLLAIAVESASATGRTMLSANSSTSVESTTTSGEVILEWVKITVVPLGVFLIGAFIWGIIQNTVTCWRNRLNEGGGGSPKADELHANIDTDPDLEKRKGQVTTYRHMDDDVVTAPDPPVARQYGMHHEPELEVPNGEELVNVHTDVTPQL